MKKQIALILLVLLSSKVLAQITYNRPSVTSIGTDWFTPITITMESDSIVNGYGYQDGLDRILFIKKKPEEVKMLSPKDWTTFFVSHIKKVKTTDLFGNSEEKYAIKLKGSMGRKTLTYKLYEKPSITLYGGYATAGISKQKRSFYFIKFKDADKAEKLLINFSEINEPMPKRVFKKFGKCIEIKKEMKKGNHKKKYEDFIKLIDLYDERCIN